MGKKSGLGKIVVIGSGAVGSTTAYTLMLRQRAAEIVLIDVDHDKALGDALDMNHGLPFVGGVKVYAGDVGDCRDADIIIVTAGSAQRPGETRQDLLMRNVTIMRDVVSQVTRENEDGILLLATNPVDVLSYIAWDQSGWPSNRVIGSGTLLDSARFRHLLGERLRVDVRSVHAHIIGEHGDTEVPIWSRTNVVGVPIDLTDEEKMDIYSETRDAAYEIIRTKGATYYAIALALDRICAAILRNERAVLNVSTRLVNYHGISDVYLSVPCIVGRNGIENVIDLEPTDTELAALSASADALAARLAIVRKP